jgi:predicted short-subunit dehydrogenase-like oxidoreductase (DUF2520 family)
VTADPERVWIVGPGRLGRALASLLHESGLAPVIGLTGRRELAPGDPLHHHPPVTYLPELRPPLAAPTVVFLAVPDREIAPVARALAQLELEPEAALHGCGSYGVEVLAPLAEAGWSTGVLHPLLPLSGSAGEGLNGALFGVAGSGSAERFARRVAEAAGGRALSVRGGAAPLYHAGAVLASGGVVSLLAAATRTLESAGVAPADAGEAALALATRALSGVAGRGAARALTGPIARGDVETVALHLERLSGVERALYCALGREALELARAGGLPETTRLRLEALLAQSP